MPRIRGRTATANGTYRPVDSHPRALRGPVVECAGIPVVYAALTPKGLIKFGFTTNLAERRESLVRRDGVVEILGFRLGSLEDEQALHKSLAPHLHHGREWYHPHPDVIGVVNEMREPLGLGEFVRR